MKSSISIFGLGYVGSVTAACFASLGHRVTGVDSNPAKVTMLQEGRSPVLEAQMNELMSQASAAGLIHATEKPAIAIQESDISFICVGTPSMRSGKLDLAHVQRVACEIGIALRSKLRPHTIVLRSTVLPGTTESFVIPTLESASGLRAGADFFVCYNPEFLREGTAVTDFLRPPYTILGAQESNTSAPLRDLYADIPGTIHETTISTAETLKYASNAFHALKVSFANEIGTFCKNHGVDAEIVTRIFTSDTKLNISPAYLAPGFAFGGSCLPKDLRALMYRTKELDLSLPLLESITPSNAEHLERAIEMILETNKTKIAVLGLSFKAATDDLRGSPQVLMVKRLLGEGCQIRIWDNNVSLGRLIGSNRQYIEEVIPHIGSLLCSTVEEAINHAEVVVIATREVDRQILQNSLKQDHIVIDLVNLEKSLRPDTHGSYAGICW